MNKKEKDGTKKLLIEKYCKIADKKGFHPSRSDLAAAKITRDKIRHHFISLVGLKKAAVEAFPKIFEGILDESIFTPKNFKKLQVEANKHSRYVLSAAVAGCPPHAGFQNAINTYNKKKDAMLVVLPCTDPAANVPFHLDSSLDKDSILVYDLALNDNIFLSSIKLSAKHVDPTTGLGRIGQRSGSFIYASPKQRLKMTPTSNVKIPHAIMTTGALTKPAYESNRYLSGRTAYIAEYDHVLGALVVEVANDRVFHYRQVQADNKGNFIDLGVMYLANGTVKPIQPEALVLGDWHSGETDELAKAAFITAPGSVLNVTKPKRIVIHDGFNGRSISHHEVRNTLLRAKRANANQLDLYKELEQYARDLEQLASYPFVEEIVIVKSNHDEFLDRYLAEGRYIEDAQNHSLALTLAYAMLKGENPIEHFVNTLNIKNAKKLKWLNRDEDYKVAGVELGAHGDRGANGARGSVQAMENAYSNSITGHSHTPEILRGAWQVGTCSLLKLEYNQGPSSWMHTSCLLYPNGSRQLINVIEGQWKLKD